MAYSITSAGEYTGGRVDDLAASLWGPGYQFLLTGTWNGNNTVLTVYDLAGGAVFHQEQTLDPAQVGNDLALATPVADRVLLGYKTTPGGKTAFLTWKLGSASVGDSQEASYQDHDLEMVAFHEPGHPLFSGGEMPASNIVVRQAAISQPASHLPADKPVLHGAPHGVTVAGNFGNTYSQKAIHAAAASITSLHKMRLAIWHFDAGGQIKTPLASSPVDVSEPATRVAMVTTAEYPVNGVFKGGELVTAVRYNNQLKLIRWRYDRTDSPPTLSRTGEALLPEPIDDCAVTTIRTSEGVVVVTAVRLTSGALKVIGWKLPADGSVSRWIEHSGEAISGISCAGVRNSDLVTAVRIQPDGHLRLIYWQFPFNGSPSGAVFRLAQKDSDVVSWVKCLHQPGPSETQPGHTITLCRLPTNRLKMIRWKLLNN